MGTIGGEYIQCHSGGKRASQKHVECKATSQLFSFDALNDSLNCPPLRCSKRRHVIDTE